MALHTSLPENYVTAIRLIDEAHTGDPRTVPSKEEGGSSTATVPYELHYARKMTRWLALRCPDPSPALQLACRAQHFRRWEIPRDEYPMTRPGYLAWRARLKARAASQVTELLASADVVPPIPEEVVARTAALIRKANLASGGDDEVQALEDVACLVFLDDQLDDFERRPEIGEDKLVDILRRTWAKMSPEGHALALAMDHSDRAKALIQKALSS